NFFLQRYPLSPACWLGYEREAFYSDTENLRITLDENIRFRSDGWDMTLPSTGQRLVEEGLYLMEVKAPFALPLWLLDIMAECGARNRSFSKYGIAYAEHLHTANPLLVPQTSPIITAYERNFDHGQVF
ncbi:MAG: VTC domain-containing protein, partial [Clostridia bacterium]|nr:VTC domain-containing protein [Clostridia bacterium]